MKIIQEYAVNIFENEYDGRKYYKMGLSHKQQDGSYENGVIDCRFRKDTEIDATKKIYIRDAWLDFYKKDKITYPYIFVNKFDYANDVVKKENVEKDAFAEFGSEVALTDEDLPF